MQEQPLGEVETDPGTPSSKRRRISETVRIVSKSERFKNYLIGIGAMTGLVLGLLSQFKGEPVAEKTWGTLRAAVNEQSQVINKISEKLIYLQAWQEAKTAIELQRKLEELQKRQAPIQQPTSLPAQGTTCPAGQALGEDHKCHRVTKSIAAKIVRDADLGKAMQLAFEAERRRRMELERNKSMLMQKLLQQTPSKTLRALPLKLDDAEKK